MTLKEVRENDFQEFLEEAVKRLSGKNYTDDDIIEVTNLLLESLDDNKSEVNKRLIKLVSHLIKWKHQPSRRGASWQRTILNQRLDIAKDLEYSRNLRNFAESIYSIVLKDAKEEAIGETGIQDIEDDSCEELTLENILDLNFVVEWTKDRTTNPLYAKSKRHKGSHKKRR